MSAFFAVIQGRFFFYYFKLLQLNKLHFSDSRTDRTTSNLASVETKRKSARIIIFSSASTLTTRTMYGCGSLCFSVPEGERQGKNSRVEPENCCSKLPDGFSHDPEVTLSLQIHRTHHIDHMMSELKSDTAAVLLWLFASKYRYHCHVRFKGLVRLRCLTHPPSRLSVLQIY